MERIWVSETFLEERDEGIIIPIHKKGDKNTVQKLQGNTIIKDNVQGAIKHIEKQNLLICRRELPPKRSIVDQIFTIRQLLKKSVEFKKDVY